MRKHTIIRATRASTTKLRLHAEIIRELGTMELRGAAVGGCRTGSDASVEPTYELAWGERPHLLSTCPMM